MNEETKHYLEWLEGFIEPTLQGKDTPLNFIIWDLLQQSFNRQQYPFDCIEDACCYLLVETFMDLDEQSAINSLQIRLTENEDMRELLLKIPLRFIVFMTK